MSVASTIRPASVEEVSAAVAEAHRDGRTVGVDPEGQTDVVLDLSRLDDVEHHPEDLVASVGCGVKFRELQAGLASKGQRLPLDPPTDKETTLGEVIGGNLFGPLRLRYGTVRDWMIGSTLVRFDGKVVKAGGMVVKNVSGYDLTKLYIGSGSALGVLVRANLKLAPLPRAAADVVVEDLDAGKAVAIVNELRSGLHPLVSAVLDGRRLVLGFEGVQDLIEGQVKEAIAISGGKKTAERTVRKIREDLSGKQSAAALRLHYPPARTADLLESIGPPEGHVSLPGSGITFLPGEEDPEKVRAAVSGVGGWMSPGPIPARTLSVMKRLKTALDPNGTFGPLSEQA